MTTNPHQALVILVTGASTGFGRLTAHTLAAAGHTVYAGILGSRTQNPAAYDECASFSQSLSQSHNNGSSSQQLTGVGQLAGIELDVTSDSVIKRAVDEIIRVNGTIDVIVHNAGHMNFGPAEAFTPEQFMTLFDVNCVGHHRLNRAVLPHMRRARRGLLIWISSGSAHGPSSPFLAAYFTAKAAQDSLAQTTALEVSRYGIETSIVVPGIFTRGTAHFASAMKAADQEIEREYLGEGGVYEGWDQQCLRGSAGMVPEDADPQCVADSVADVVAMKRGERPWRVHVETEGKCAEVVNGVRDLVREKYLAMMGCEELMKVEIDD